MYMKKFWVGEKLKAVVGDWQMNIHLENQFSLFCNTVIILLKKLL